MSRETLLIYLAICRMLDRQACLLELKELQRDARRRKRDFNHEEGPVV